MPEQPTFDAPLQDLIGKRVQVTSIGADRSFTDAGQLVAYVHPWVRLRTDGGETLCLSVYHIRLLKAV